MSGFDDGASQASSRRSRASAIGADAANSSKQFNFSEPLTTRVLTKYFPLFPLFKTYKQAPMQVVTLCGMLIFALQRWAFLINPHYQGEWGSVMGGTVAKILYGAQLTFYDPAEIPAVSSATVLIIFMYVILVSTVALYVCIMLHLRQKDDQEEAKGVAARTARLILDATSSMLFIPILQVIFASLVCDANGHMWMLPAARSGKCWGAEHVACFVPALLVGLTLLPLVYLRRVCVYDYNPLTDNFTARRYSTVDRCTFFHDVVAVFLFSLMTAYGVSGGYAVLMAFNAAILVAAYVYYLPFYSLHVTRFYVVVHTVETLAAVFLAAALMSDPFLTATLSSSLLIGVGVVLVFMMLLITDYRVNPNFLFAMKRSAECVPMRDAAGLHSEEDPHRSRAFEENKIFEVDDKEVSELPYPKGLVTTDVFSQYVGMNAKVVESIMRQGINAYLDNFETPQDTSKLLPVLESYVDTVLSSSDVLLAVSFLDAFSAQFGQAFVSPMMLLFAANIYSRALVTFPDDPTVLQGFISFIVTYLPSMSFMGVDLVKRTLRLPTTVDQQFRAQKQINELRLALGIRTHAHSIRSIKARMAHAKVLQSVHRFWVKLTEPTVNVKEVSELADEISTRREAAVAHFDLALRRQQNADPVLLRRLGDFFADILMAPDAAQECYEEAKDILDARQARSMAGTRAHAAEVDVVALTERQCSVLAAHAKSGSGSQMIGAASSNLMYYFSAFVNIVLLVVVACSAVFLFIASHLTMDLRKLLSGTMAISNLRISASRYGSVVLGYAMTRDAEAVANIRATLQEMLDTFATNFAYLTTGDGRVGSKEARFLMSQNTIPLYSYLVDNSHGVSIQALSNSFMQGMQSFLNTSALTSPTGYSDTEKFLVTASRPLADAFSKLLDLQAATEVHSVSVRWIIWLVVAFAVSLACLVTTYSALQLAFRRTTLARVLAFQLLTLIPYEALERLSTEAKERYHQIHMEKSLRQAPESSKSSPGSDHAEARAKTQRASSDVSPLPAQHPSRQLLVGEASAPVAAAAAAAGKPAVLSMEDLARELRGGVTAAYRASQGDSSTQGELHTSGVGLPSPAAPPLASVAEGGPQDVARRAGTGAGSSTAAFLLAAPLKSCLKGGGGTFNAGSLSLTSPRAPQAPATPGRSPTPTSGPHNAGRVVRDKERRVRFDPVVQVVGGSAEGGRDARDAAAKRRGEEEEVAEENVDALLLAEAGTRHAMGKKGVTEEVSDAHNAFRGTLVYFVVVLACFVGCTVLLGVTVKGPLQYMQELHQLRGLQERLISLQLRIPQLSLHTTAFLHSGSVYEFQAAHDHNSYAYQDIPKLMGVDVPLSVSTSLTRMHKIVQLIGNVSMDVSVLAARGHGVSLAYASDARTRDALSDRQMLALMRSKYPSSLKRVDDIAKALRTFPILRFVAYGYSIWYDSALPLVKEYRHLCSRAMHDAVSDTASRAVLSRQNLASVIALSSLAIATSVLIAVSPRQRVISAYMPRRHTVMVAIAFAPLAALSVALLVMGSSQSARDLNRYDAALKALDDAVDTLMTFTGHIGHFTHSVVPLYFAAARDAAAAPVRHALSDVIIERYGLDTETVSAFMRFTSCWSELSRLCNITAALTINVFASMMEAPMLQALEASHWDFSIERDYYERSALYTLVDTKHQYDILYTTKAQDLARPAEHQYLVAVNTITSDSFAKAYEGAVTAVGELYARFIRGSFERNRECTQKRLVVLYAALGACALPLMACIYMSATAVVTLRFLFRVTSSSSSSVSGAQQLAVTTSTSESARYATTLSRARYSFLLVGVLLAATFGVGIWLTQTGFVVVKQLGSVANQQALVSVTLDGTRQLFSPQLTFVAPSMIYDDLEVLTNNMVLLTHGRMRSGVPIGLHLSHLANVLNFGPTDVAAQLQVTASFLRNNCSQFLYRSSGPLPLRAEEDYGGGLGMPLTEAIADWAAVVVQIVSLMEDMSGKSLAQVADILGSMNAVVTKLLPAFAVVNNDVMNASERFNRRMSTILVLLAALTLAATLVVHLVVIVPALARLFREEDALRMLLHMIPTAVRDEVPAISQFMETGQVANMAALQKKFEANEKLLQNILPQKIAARLKSGEQPIADTHKSVTMLFTDFVGFTKRSSSMQAREIVDFLNEVFLEFDTVVELLGLEKIKTIGDAFFMAGGLDPQISDHALRVVEAGVKFFEALEEHNRRHPSRQPLQMRLGVHTGPVVAGVIGTKKVAYDLWGESVEIANALESTGVPGYVHISEETAKYVRGFFRLCPRGELPREKDHIPENMPKTYLVVGRELPTPYMHLRRPRLLPTNFQEIDKEKGTGREKEKQKRDR